MPLAGISSAAVDYYLGKRSNGASSSPPLSSSVALLSSPEKSLPLVNPAATPTPPMPLHIHSDHTNFDAETFDSIACMLKRDRTTLREITLPSQIKLSTKNLNRYRGEQAEYIVDMGCVEEEKRSKLCAAIMSVDAQMEDVKLNEKRCADDMDCCIYDIEFDRKRIKLTDHTLWDSAEKAYAKWTRPKIRDDMGLLTKKDVYALSGVQSLSKLRRLVSCGFECRPDEDIHVPISRAPKWKYHERLIRLLQVPDEPTVVEEQDDEAELAQLKRQIEEPEAKMASSKKARRA